MHKLLFQIILDMHRNNMFSTAYTYGTPLVMAGIRVRNGRLLTEDHKLSALVEMTSLKMLLMSLAE